MNQSGVGKSSILLKYTTNEFKRDYNVTIGVEFGSKYIQLDADTRIKLQVWDTAGQESFRAIVRSFYRSAAAIFLVYDVNCRQSFQNLESWLNDIRINCDPNATLILMGNKADIDDHREVSYEEGESFMQENNVSFFFETSALNGQNVETAFVEATKLAFLRYIKDRLENDPSKEKSKGFTLGNKAAQQPKEKKSGCC